MANRKIIWVSSLDIANSDKINLLENSMSNFYRNSANYYADIDFTADNWVNAGEKGYADIIETCRNTDNILEVGCGSANILKHGMIEQSNYFGCDFSEELINSNKATYPLANFDMLTKPNLLPYSDNMFDVVYSVFVIEHSCYPAKFIDECCRVLKQNGTLIILCPDFLGRGRMSSQRAGYSQGTTTDKFRKLKIIDAIVTYYDNKIRIPSHCKSFAFESVPKFYINLQPTVFIDKFIPDVDAVYITYKWEMQAYLTGKMKLIENDVALKKYEQERKLIYLKMRKQ